MLALIPNQKLSTSWWNPKHGKPYSESIHCVGDSEVSYGSELWHSLTTLGFSHVATAQPVEALIFHGCCDSLRSWAELPLPLHAENAERRQGDTAEVPADTNIGDPWLWWSNTNGPNCRKHHGSLAALRSWLRAVSPYFVARMRASDSEAKSFERQGLKHKAPWCRLCSGQIL